MKEVLAFIQMNKMESTKDALDVIGIPFITVYKASSRGKQRGLQIPHLRVRLCNHDRHRASHRLLLGYEVSMHLVDDMANALLENRERGPL